MNEPNWQELRWYIQIHGTDSLKVDDLTSKDLEKISWSGSPTHLKSVARALERVPSGDVEYLAVRSKEGYSLAKGGIDYSIHEDAGTLWQLATHEKLRSLGIGTKLIVAAEKRIKNRGLKFAIMGVEDDNPRALQLYQKLDYPPFGHAVESWEQEDEQGNVTTHTTKVTLLRKTLVRMPRRGPHRSTPSRLS